MLHRFSETLGENVTFVAPILQNKGYQFLGRFFCCLCICVLFHVLLNDLVESLTDDGFVKVRWVLVFLQHTSKLSYAFRESMPVGRGIKHTLHSSLHNVLLVSHRCKGSTRETNPVSVGFLYQVVPTSAPVCLTPRLPFS